MPDGTDKDASAFDPLDLDRLYANYLRSCTMSGIEPVPRERAPGLVPPLPWMVQGGHMQLVHIGMLLGTALAIAGLASAQPGRDASGIEVVVKKKPGGQNMACVFNGQPCSEKVVRQVSAEASKRGVMVALAGTDGSLKCTTRERKECSDDAVGIVQAAAKTVSVRGISGS